LPGGRSRQEISAGDSFVVEDGCLKAVAHPRIVEDLFARDTYSDFELDFDWKISPGRQ